jgi:hypothetical protein
MLNQELRTLGHEAIWLNNLQLPLAVAQGSYIFKIGKLFFENLSTFITSNVSINVVIVDYISFQEHSH